MVSKPDSLRLSDEMVMLIGDNEDKLGKSQSEVDVKTPVRYSPLLENLPFMQAGEEPPPISRKPRDHPSAASRRSSGGGHESEVPMAGRRNSGSFQQAHLDPKQYQLFQMQRLKYWEQRHRLQQQKKEIELRRRNSQTQQLMHLYQHQYAVQWQQQQQLSMQRQQLQHLVMRQQMLNMQKEKQSSRRSSAPAVHRTTHRSQSSDAYYSRMHNDLAARLSLQQRGAQAEPVLQQRPGVGSQVWHSRSRTPVFATTSLPLGVSVSNESISPVPLLQPQYGLCDAAELTEFPDEVDSSLPSRYPGPSLMTDEEKEWIKQVQLQTVPAGHTVQHFNADYYFIKQRERKARREGKTIETFTVTSSAQETDETDGGSHLADGMMYSQATRGSSSRAAMLPDTLGGRVSAGSARYPRQIVDLERNSEGEAIAPVCSTEAMSTMYQPLMAIEHAFELLLALEEQERQSSVPQGDGLLISHPERREETLDSLMAVLGFGKNPDVTRMRDVLVTQKGVSLIARVLPALSLEIAQQVALAAFQHLSEVGSSQDSDIEGIRTVLPCLARSLIFVLKQSSLELLTSLLEHLLALPECIDGSPGAVAVICYGGTSSVSLLTCLITEGCKRCSNSNPGNYTDTVSKEVHAWRNLTVQLYYMLEEHSAFVSEVPIAQQFFSQLILLAGSSFAHILMDREPTGRGLPSPPAYMQAEQAVVKTPLGRTQSVSSTSSTSSSKGNSITVVRLDCR